MKLFQHTFKIAVVTYLMGLATAAVANDDCVKPKVAGMSQEDMSCLGDGLILSFDTSSDEYKPMVLDSKGNVIIKPGRYKYVFNATEGLIGVGAENLDNKTGYMEFRAGFVSQKTGKEVIPLKYMSTGEYDIDINRFSEGLVALLQPNEKYGYLNTSGKTVIPFIYDSANDFSEGLAAVSKGGYEKGDYYVPGKYGFIDKSGKTAIPFKYDYANDFSEGLATVGLGTDYSDMTYGVIDKTGKQVIPIKSKHFIGKFSNGLAAVLNINDETYGFINRSGTLVIPYNYMLYSDESVLPSFKNGKVYVDDKNVNSYCINTKGQKVSCDN